MERNCSFNTSCIQNHICTFQRPRPPRPPRPSRRLVSDCRPGGSQTRPANEVSGEVKCHPVKMLSDSLEAPQRTERSLVLTNTHGPFGSVKGAVQDSFFFASSFLTRCCRLLFNLCIAHQSSGPQPQNHSFPKKNIFFLIDKI